MTMLFGSEVAKLLVKLLVDLSGFFKEGTLKNVRIAHEEVDYLISKEADYLISLIRIFRLPLVHAFFIMGKGLFYSLAIILIIMIIYLLINSTRWRRARVFVSYQHVFEDVAA